MTATQPQEKTTVYQEEESPSLLNRVLDATNSAIEALNRGEISAQVQIAHLYRRDITRFKAAARAMATLDEVTASGCFYTLPRDGKQITGPSIRLAEICASCWGNIRHGARVVEEGDRFLTAHGYCHDLETNQRDDSYVRRQITGRNGRYKDNMIQTTGAAACSIAKRNAIFAVIPRVFVDAIEQEARKVAAGDEKTLVARRQQAFAYWASQKIDEARVLSMLGRPGIEDVGLEDLVTLKGVYTAIRDGQTKIEEVFPVPGTLTEGTRTQRLAAALGSQAQQNGGATAPIPELQPAAPPTNTEGPPAGEPQGDAAIVPQSDAGTYPAGPSPTIATTQAAVIAADEAAKQQEAKQLEAERITSVIDQARNEAQFAGARQALSEATMRVRITTEKAEQLETFLRNRVAYYCPKAKTTQRGRTRQPELPIPQAASPAV